MAAAKPVLHGRDHAENGPDPIPRQPIQIEQGALVIPSLLDLIITQGLTLTDDGAGVAELDAGIIGSWTPALHQATTDPTGTWTSGGQYAKLKDLVVLAGAINFGSGFTNGTGVWSIQGLPFGFSGLNTYASGSGILRGFLHDHQMFFTCSAGINSVSPPDFTLSYQDAVPVSTRQTFDGTVWGGTWNGDGLNFYLVYFTTDVDP